MYGHTRVPCTHDSWFVNQFRFNQRTFTLGQCSIRSASALPALEEAAPAVPLPVRVGAVQRGREHRGSSGPVRDVGWAFGAGRRGVRRKGLERTPSSCGRDGRALQVGCLHRQGALSHSAANGRAGHHREC